MSPIGRVFVVLNLVLAGAFVGFAGTYLKHHTNWKEQHGAVSKQFEEKKKADESTINSLTTDLQTAKRELLAIQSLSKRDAAELADKKAENERLSQQVASLDADIKAIKGDYATVASKVETASEDAKKTLALAMAADEEKHKALNSKTEADAKLAEATAKIAALETSVANLNGDVAKRDQTIGEQRILIENWKTKFPGIVITAQPDVEGRISNVSGNLVTLEITDKKGELQPGNTLAIYNGNSYKAEMFVNQVEGNFAFGKILMQVQGKPVAVGDRASTNPTR